MSASVVPAEDEERAAAPVWSVADWCAEYCVQPEGPLLRRWWTKVLGPGLRLPTGGITAAAPPAAWIWQRPPGNATLVLMTMLTGSVWGSLLLTLVPMEAGREDPQSLGDVWVFAVAVTLGLFGADFAQSDVHDGGADRVHRGVLRLFGAGRPGQRAAAGQRAGVWLLKRVTMALHPAVKRSYVGLAFSECFIDTLATMILVGGSFHSSGLGVVLAMAGVQVLTGLVLPVALHKAAHHERQLGWAFGLGRASSQRDADCRMACKFAMECVEHCFAAAVIAAGVTLQREGPNADNFSAGHWSQEAYERFLVGAAVWVAVFGAVLVLGRPLVRRTPDADPLEMALRLADQHLSVLAANATSVTLLFMLLAARPTQVMWFVFPADGFSH